MNIHFYTVYYNVIPKITFFFVLLWTEVLFVAGFWQF